MINGFSVVKQRISGYFGLGPFLAQESLFGASESRTGSNMASGRSIHGDTHLMWRLHWLMLDSDWQLRRFTFS
jgi:hypothetical protein